ncbi:bifunctional 2-polyprenyl-6-hydroxyphenol methylase/3-demethylubiquinol 3-O-methyltransferase UbiG [Salinimonas sediminis]|uniref:Ubiquinone biosynthesis O-methyltransferase n=1 Tax=Salinimonas sediminis TaxID=2303538 RepID=A0A346NR49_9ALTE|nr:bifunctional 2-polyprenyl-6-hydroxyphenol methylase/3-demethylubiquinol 3-O-methyltransferase UbiG [Salinimonas sediminis]AXR08006.1 bifunctional 2-polyprenyl-6-hydroxyphenol methylase/3-demethylubiquinol 3-O-methyltransferase UbiG [Salinimonas sediminis]
MLDKSELSGELENQNMSPEEIARFDALAESWWDPNGRYKTALAFNAARVAIIQEQICKAYNRFAGSAHSLKDIRILDVGCGGGLISEALAKAGASVTGIDASATSIEVARRHAQQSGIDVKYQHLLASQLSSQLSYDVVINAEVVEHVPDQPALIQDCARLVNPGGMLILATLNRTIKSYLVAIAGAEYIMGYLPKGTHDWKKFVTPEELDSWTGDHFTRSFDTGMRLNPFSKKWKTTRSLAVNYMLCYRHS